MFSEIKFLNKRPLLINAPSRSKNLNKRPGRLLEDLQDAIKISRRPKNSKNWEKFLLKSG